MATVITNLISAIPWIGQDIVEFKKKNLVSLKQHLIIFFSGLFFFIIINNKKKLEALPFTTIYYYAASLPVIGIIDSKSRAKKLNRLSEPHRGKAEYLAIPKSFLAFLIGFIDGDGYIGIKKSYKDQVEVYLSISIHLEDITILNYIQSILKIGKIYSYPNRKSPTVRLVISKSELQEVLFPLFLHHELFFLTKTRRAQYHMAMYIFNNNVKKYSELPSVAPIIQELPVSALEYANLPFFKDWVVGFVCAEGSFFIKTNLDGCFQIKQKLHLLLFEAFKLVFNTNRKITGFAPQIPQRGIRGLEKEFYAQFGVSSKSDIQNVINFFSFSGYHPLVGLKNIQYSAWLDKLRNSERYKNLKFPT